MMNFLYTFLYKNNKLFLIIIFLFSHSIALAQISSEFAGLLPHKKHISKNSERNFSIALGLGTVSAKGFGFLGSIKAQLKFSELFYLSTDLDIFDGYANHSNRCYSLIILPQFRIKVEPEKFDLFIAPGIVNTALPYDGYTFGGTLSVMPQYNINSSMSTGLELKYIYYYEFRNYTIFHADLFFRILF